MAKKKTKKQKKQKKPAPKEISFDFSGPEERDETIRVDGFKSFSIRFRVPDGSTKLDGHVASITQMAFSVGAIGKKKGDEDADLDVFEGTGLTIIRTILAHLKSWTLPQKVERASLMALAKANDDAVIAIHAAITKAGDERKN